MAKPNEQQQPQTAVATQPQQNQVAKPNVLGTLQGLLTQYKKQIEMAIPEHLTADRLIRISLTAVSQSPKLQECSPLSICGAVIQAGILGLEPTSVLGECFLVPFWNKKANGGRGGQEAQLVVGYQGKIKLVANTGELLGVKAAPVRKNDEFQFDDGLDPFVSHKYHHIQDRGPVIGFWAGAKLKSGFTSIVFMTVKEVEEHRDRFAMTKTKDGAIFGVWKDNFESMALKTMIHKALKYLPKSVRAATAWALDERAEAGIPQKFSVEVPLELCPAGADEFNDAADDKPKSEPLKEPQSTATKAAEAAQENSVAREDKKSEPLPVDKSRAPWIDKFSKMEANLGSDEFYRRLGAGPDSYGSVEEILTSKMAGEFARMEKG